MDTGTDPSPVTGSQDGAYAILFAILLLVFFGFAAFAMDIAANVEVKQKLHDTLDAAAHAGATELPPAAFGITPAEGRAAAVAARARALDYAQRNDPSLFSGGESPQVVFWCIVAQEGGAPKASQIGVSCDPGLDGNADARCNATTCAMPCDPLNQTDICNTIQVLDGKAVPYTFAPVIGIDEGGTGRLDGAACKGNCGADVVGPLDLVLVLDRTPSMRAVDIAALKDAARGLLESLRPDRHRVALVVHGPSKTAGGCPTSGVRQNKNSAQFPLNGGSTWLAVPFSDDYDDTDLVPAPAIPDLDDTSTLVAAISCLANSDYGTDLGDPLLAAGHYLSAQGRDGVPNGILFMSDGEPTLPHGTGGTPMDHRDCDYSLSRATATRALGAPVLTIAYRLQGVGVDCRGAHAGIDLATELLAGMASDPPDGPRTADDGADHRGWTADGGCDNAEESADENGDGDYFFCAPEPSQLGEVLRQATLQLLDDIRLVRIPG